MTKDSQREKFYYLLQNFQGNLRLFKPEMLLNVVPLCFPHNDEYFDNSIKKKR